MATIQSSIMLNDRMTSVFTNIVSSVNTTIRTMQRLDSTSVSPDVSQLQQASAQLRIAENELNEMVASSQQLNNNLGQTSGIAGSLKSKLMGIGAGMLAGFSVKKIIEASDKNAQITARLNLISDDPEMLKKQIYASAQDARIAYTEAADGVAKLGLLAKDAFRNTDEVVMFSNLVGKSLKIAGADIQQADAAMLQLTQAMASGRLQGDEFVSVLENAPMIAQAIAKHMNVTMGQLKEMSSKGKITSDIIKAAVFSAADDINAKFGQMPMTWTDIWTQMKNYALFASDGVLKKVNQIANSQAFQKFLSGAQRAFGVLLSVANTTFNAVAGFAKIIIDNWSLISPVIYGVVTALTAYAAIQGLLTLMEWASVAAKVALGVASVITNAAVVALTFVTGGYTAAQTAANAAAWSFPGTWIAAIIIGVIAAVIALIVAIVKWGTGTATVAGTVVGIFYWVGAAFYNVVAWIVNTAVGMANSFRSTINSMAQGAADVASAIANVFIDGFNLIARKAAEILNGIFDKARAFAGAIDGLMGTNLSSAVNVKFTAKQAGHVQIKAAQLGMINGGNSQVMQMKDLGGAYNKGVGKGNDMAAKFGGVLDDINGIMKGLEVPMGDQAGGKGADPNNKKTADNTGKMAKQLEKSEDDLKYMRDIAEQEYINRFTTAEIKIDMTNNATINTPEDANDFWKILVDGANVAIETMTEGSYN